MLRTETRSQARSDMLENLFSYPLHAGSKKLTTKDLGLSLISLCVVVVEAQRKRASEKCVKIKMVAFTFKLFFINRSVEFFVVKNKY